jgi:predicted ferric reductase
MYSELVLPCIVALVAHVLISYSFPYMYDNLFTSEMKRMFSDYRDEILSNRNNLGWSSLYIVIIVLVTTLLTPLVKDMLAENQRQPSILNLAKLLPSKTS